MSAKNIFRIVSAGTLLAFLTLVSQVRHFARSQLFGTETMDVQVTEGSPLVYGTIDFIYSLLHSCASIAHTLYAYPVIAIAAGMVIVLIAATVCKGARIDAVVAATTLVGAVAAFAYFEAPWLFINKVPSPQAFHLEQQLDTTNRVQLQAAGLWQCLICSRIGDLQAKVRHPLCPNQVSKSAAEARLTNLFGWNFITIVMLVIVAAVYWLARGKILDDAALPATSRAVVAVLAYAAIIIIALDVYGVAYVNGKSQMTTTLNCVQQVYNEQRYDAAYRIASTDNKATLIYGVGDIFVFSADSARKGTTLASCGCPDPDALTHLLQDALKMHQATEPVLPPRVPLVAPKKGDTQACAGSSPWRSL